MRTPPSRCGRASRRPSQPAGQLDHEIRPLCGRRRRHAVPDRRHARRCAAAGRRSTRPTARRCRLRPRSDLPRPEAPLSGARPRRRPRPESKPAAKAKAKPAAKPQAKHRAQPKAKPKAQPEAKAKPQQTERRASKPAAATGFTAPVSGVSPSTAYRASGSSWSSGHHTGIDFPVGMGTSVKAVAGGQVVSAGWAGAYGYEVVIRHADGKYSQYAHLSPLSVRAGPGRQRRSAGRPFGLDRQRHRSASALRGAHRARLRLGHQPAELSARPRHRHLSRVHCRWGVPDSLSCTIGPPRSTSVTTIRA